MSYIYKDKKIKDDPGHEIKFCCKSCLKDFNKDPKGYIKKIDEAEAKAAKKVSLLRCSHFVIGFIVNGSRNGTSVTDPLVSSCRVTG